MDMVKNNWIKKNSFEIILIFVFILFIVGTYFSPQLIYRFYPLIGDKYENTGVLGETINGLTAPWIGMFSTTLLFIALLKQIKSNRFNQNESSFKIIYQEICKVKNELDSFEFKFNSRAPLENTNENNNESIPVYGKVAFTKWASQLYYYITINDSNKIIENLKKCEKPVKIILRLISINEKLRTGNKFDDFIKNELKDIYLHYFKEAHDIVSIWSQVNLNVETNNQLNLEKKKWNDIKAQILRL